ncbi:MAG: UMP kinase [Lachnospiraceae bacterium]|nr:UMP kinase [Lachnospiraceae bacterium]MBQ1514472.1 UMP kinase [Lachnospiraceae bacterium]MBQ4309872.1 UMP kinase [Lachnospiraceae bacterium]MBR0401728.1 UMP kinase [Lachnospiraceae bacterium]MCR5537689.1 UMP kinase [Lachnospiraceae bacterium]
MERKHRVLLKLSGEACSGDKGFGFDEDTVRAAAVQVKEAVENGYQIAVVIGGGNFWRGRSSDAIERTKADQIGMLATVMNCVYVSEIFRSEGMRTSLYTPFACGNVSELYSKDRAVADLEDGKVVFFGGGTGHPYFSTDTTVALRAIEMEAEKILLAKSIDGVYDADPAKVPDAKKYRTVSIEEVIEKKLQVVDLTASVMCMENRMPMVVFAMNTPGSIVAAIKGEIDGTEVTV